MTDTASAKEQANPLLAMFEEHRRQIDAFPREGLSEMGRLALDKAAHETEASITLATLTMNAWPASTDELGIELPAEESGLQ